MSGLHVVPPGAGTAERPTCLAPAGEFPAELADLPLVELQVLHSRVTCQLELEYVQHPDGPHPVTRDRYAELTAELGARGQPGA